MNKLPTAPAAAWRVALGRRPKDPPSERPKDPPSELGRRVKDPPPIGSVFATTSGATGAI
jgi:hypothetical protein